MIDTDKYEELLENGMQHRDLWELAAELLAEVKRLREKLRLTKEWLDQLESPLLEEVIKYVEAIE